MAFILTTPEWSGNLLLHGAAVRAESAEDVGTISLTAAITSYLVARKALGEINPDTTKALRRVLIDFANITGRDRSIGRVARRHVMKYLDVKERSGVTASTRRHYVSTLRTFSAWCVREKLCRDFMDGIRGPRTTRSVPRAVKATDVATILDACEDQREKVAALLMVQAGLRCCEVSRLRWCDIDLDARTMFVTGKGGHERDLPIVDELAAELERFRTDEPATLSEAVIRSRRERDGRAALQPHTIGTLVARAMRQAGVKLAAHDGKSAHALRHSFASDVLSSGADVRDLQEALGHESLTSTQIYVKRMRAATNLRGAMEGRRYGMAG